MTTAKKTLVGNRVVYRHSKYIFREGIVLEDAGEKVRVHWNKEFFKNPNTGNLISLQTWVSKPLLLAADWGYGKTVEALLDNDQDTLTEIANNRQQWLKTATGQQCPECRSSEVRTDGVDYGICDNCDCSFSF